MKQGVVFFPIWCGACLLLALSSSCRHADDSDGLSSDAVNFSAEVVRGASKGSPATGDNLTQFAVFGYRQGEKLWSDELQASILPSLFYDVPVDKQSDGSWSYGQPVKWDGLSYDRYAFFGYAPKAAGPYEDQTNPMGNNLVLTGDASTAGMPVLEYETLTNVESQIDLLAGSHTNLMSDNKVTMRFTHVLSQIRFVAWSAQVGVMPVSIAINGIQYKGSLSAKGNKVEWLSTDPGTSGFVLRDNFPSLSIKEDQKTDLSANGRSFMLLPQDLTANTTATIEIISRVGGVEVATRPYVINENWEAGKSYTYVLKLGGNPTEELVVTEVLIDDWVVDGEEHMSTTPVGYAVNPPTADQYVEIDGLKWTTGNLVAKNKYQCQVGAPTDGGVYFQFGSLIGWKGGNSSSSGTGQGTPSYASGYWGGAGSWSWGNDAMVWPATMTSTPAAWSSNAEQATEANAFKRWYFDFSGTSQIGSINYATAQSDIRSYTHPDLGALKEGKMASLGVGDPCTYYLGDPWRLPTADEYAALDGAGRGDWTTNSGVNGRWWGPSPWSASSSVFVPASGRRDATSGAFDYVPTGGYYWSSSVSSAADGCRMGFNSSTVRPQDYYNRSGGFPVRCVSGTYVAPNPVNPPTANDYVEIDGLKWTKGNLVASSSTASGSNGCKVGAPEDGGLYFQFGSLIGWKGGNSSSSGTGQGTPSYTSGYWGSAGSWSWGNDAMVWPTKMTSTPTAWSTNVQQATEADAFKKGYFDFSGTSQNGSINYATGFSDIRSYTHPDLGALKEGKMASLGIGDPCTYYLGDPWRLPTAAEFKAVFDNANNGTGLPTANWSWVTAPYPGPQHKSKPLYVPASGYRNYSSGAFLGVTADGYYWSSSVYSATGGYTLGFTISYVAPQHNLSRSFGFPVRCVSGTYVDPSNPVNPPTADQYVEIDGLKWTKGNLVAKNSNECKVGAPTDGGLYFQFGSLIGWKGGNSSSSGTGQGTPSYTSGYWGSAGSWSWSNDAMVWPMKMVGTPSSWPKPSSGTAHQWYFSGQGVPSGSINANDPTKGVGDPCTYYLGDPWRLPTAAEFNALFDNAGPGTGLPTANWNWTTSPYNGAQHKSKPLYVPASGYRSDSSGAFTNVTTYGYYWSSSVYSATLGYYLCFYSGGVYPQSNYYRSLGFPVRCVSPTAP